MHTHPEFGERERAGRSVRSTQPREQTRKAARRVAQSLGMTHPTHPPQTMRNPPATSIMARWLACSTLGTLAWIGAFPAHAQGAPVPCAVNEPRSWHALYVEIAGAGVLGSLNYELRFVRQASVRTGFLWAPDQEHDIYIVPIMGFYLLGHGASKLEMGAGSTLAFGLQRGNHYLASVALGYRYQPDPSGEFFRISWTPLFSLDDKAVVLTRHVELGFWGASVGATF